MNPALPPEKDFDDYNTRELRRLNSELTVALQEQTAAQSVSDSLSLRLAAFQTKVAVSQADADASTANLAATRSAAQTVDKAMPLALEARKQAGVIVDLIQPVLEKAHATAQRYIEVLEAIDDLASQVARRQAKNELTSPYIISGTAKLQTDAAAGLAALTTALQKTMIAFAAAVGARDAADPVIAANARLRAILAPVGPVNLHQLTGESLWPEGKEPTSIVDLANAIRVCDYAVLAVLDSLQQMSIKAAKEQQDATTQTALDLNTANDKLNRATARVQSARASLAAAETAVA